MFSISTLLVMLIISSYEKMTWLELGAQMALPQNNVVGGGWHKFRALPQN